MTNVKLQTPSNCEHECELERWRNKFKRKKKRIMMRNQRIEEMWERKRRERGSIKMKLNKREKTFIDNGQNRSE
jgi:hypothetical protein